MQQIIAILQSVDVFGAFFTQRIHFEQKSYKTVLGGVITLLIMLFSSIFLIFNIITWQNGTNLPIINTTKKMIRDQLLEPKENYLRIMGNYQLVDVKIYSRQEIDPFNPESLILEPQVLKMANSTQTLQQYFIIKNSRGQFEVQFFNLSLRLNEKNSNENIEYLVVFGICNNSTIQVKGKCAPNSLIQSYLSRPGKVIEIQTITSQFNVQSQLLESITLSAFYIINDSSLLYTQSDITLGTLILDTGILFPSLSEISFVASNNIITQQLKSNELQEIFHKDLLLCIFLKLNPIQQIDSVQYQKINQILADTGSIVSLIFYSQYIASFFSALWMENEIIDKIISMYYPDIKKKVTIHRNFIGKIKRVNFKTHASKFNEQSFIRFYMELEVIAKKKLTVLNQIYEISRLQFLIQSFIDRMHILESHDIGISIFQQNGFRGEVNELSKVHPTIFKEVDTRDNNPPFNKHLYDVDYTLLVQETKQTNSRVRIVPSKPTIKEFFQINKI